VPYLLPARQLSQREERGIPPRKGMPAADDKTKAQEDEDTEPDRARHDAMKKWLTQLAECARTAPLPPGVVQQQPQPQSSNLPPPLPQQQPQQPLPSLVGSSIRSGKNASLL